MDEKISKLYGLYFPVLDHGFVSLVDSMGNDAAIAQAARCSYGAGTKKISDDRNLIRYLVRKNHTSPLEQVEIKLHCKMPIFVARQWVRHRTACLAGDVPVSFGAEKHYTCTMKELYNEWKMGKQIQHMLIKTVNEKTGEVYNSRIKNIWSSGVKPVHKIKFSDNSLLKATMDHRCLTTKGWMTLKEALESKADFYGIEEKDQVLIRKPIEITSIKYTGEEETFDLEVEGPFHNFIAGGVVVHNSLNEMSGRYSIMPLQFYTPEHSNIKAQSKTNKQGREEDIDEQDINQYILNLNNCRNQSSEAYKQAIKSDIARELARIDLPLSTYTEWYWKMDLHNLMHFLNLRCDGHAQWEIRQYADIIGGIVKMVTPIAFEAWEDYKFYAQVFTRLDCILLQKTLTQGKSPTKEDALNIGMSAREWQEYQEKIKNNGSRTKDFSLDLSNAKTPDYFKKEAEKYVPTI